MSGCTYPNVSYGPVDWSTPEPQGRYVIDMPASMRNPDGPWVARPMAGFRGSQDTARSFGLGAILGIGVIIALVVVVSTGD